MPTSREALASLTSIPITDSRVTVVYRQADGTKVDAGRMEVEVVILPDGSLEIEDPSPLRDLPRAARLNVVLSVLEMRAIRGNLSAAALLLQHRRWQHEQRKGKAPVRVEHSVRGGLVVVNDLAQLAAMTSGRKDVVDITPHSRTLPPPEGESGVVARTVGYQQKPRYSSKGKRLGRPPKKKRRRPPLGPPSDEIKAGGETGQAVGTPAVSGSHRDSQGE